VETNRAAASKQLLAHARLFAALNIAQADMYIRTWRVKYREHFWRPYTAINFPLPGDELDAGPPDAVRATLERRYDGREVSCAQIFHSADVSRLLS
jgi:hypothetical protein